MIFIYIFFITFETTLLYSHVFLFSLIFLSLLFLFNKKKRKVVVTKVVQKLVVQISLLFHNRHQQKYEYILTQDPPYLQLSLFL